MDPSDQRIAEIWQALHQEQERIKSTHMLAWFDSDPDRFARMSYQVGDMLVDFSKQRIDQKIHEQLMALVNARGIEQSIQDMFSGAILNQSENRAVLHVALRNSVAKDLEIAGENVSSLVEQELSKMLDTADIIRRGEWLGFSEDAITDVVHIGIGGSDLGPRMISKALTPFHGNRVSVHFVSNIDAHEILGILATLNPATTLFLIASKSFGTEETLCNAKIARNWVVDHFADPGATRQHMLALSSNAERVSEFGIDPNNRYEFWDWVGGRYSVWSVIGMPIAISIGSEAFRQFLAGANTMDVHFRKTPMAQNLPVMMAVTGIWNRNFMGYASQAIVPYFHYLDLLAQYLQQAEMESNGKQVSLSGQPLEVSTSPVVWGTSGTDAQHAYFQMLHQGTEIAPVDFILSRRSQHHQADSHGRLLAHAIAQSEALLRGKNPAEGSIQQINQRRCPGNRPSTTVLLEQVDPHGLGALIALYEHKIFVQGRLLGLNSFDQFGVELGKELAKELLPMVQGIQEIKDRDGSTEQLLRRCAQKIN